MNAYVTSIGEITTDICVWSLQRYGFDVRLKQSSSTLWEKLNEIYKEAEDDFIRVDADVVVNQNVLELIKLDKAWWYQGMVYEWFRQDVGHGGVQFVRQPALEHIRKRLAEAERQERPESYLSRIPELHNPRRFESFEKICGLHGYRQLDVERVKQTKMRRGRYGDFDWDLAEKLDSL